MSNTNETAFDSALPDHIPDRIRERLHLRLFDGIPLWCMITGSAVYGQDDVPGDVDYICLDCDGLHTRLVTAGWDSNGASGTGRFVSLRKGITNLILGRIEFVELWIDAHDFLVFNPIWAVSKDRRIMVFERLGAGRDIHIDKDEPLPF